MADPSLEVGLEAEFDRRWGVDAAVMIVDMSGYSRMAAEFGPARSLLAIRRMEATGVIIVSEFGGRYVKTWADNLMATFPDVDSAHKAALTLMALVPCACGIGWGRILDFGADLAGCEVNWACKLGEDVAKRGQVMFTAAAEAQIGRGQGLNSAS